MEAGVKELILKAVENTKSWVSGGASSGFWATSGATTEVFGFGFEQIEYFESWMREGAYDLGDLEQYRAKAQGFWYMHCDLYGPAPWKLIEYKSMNTDEDWLSLKTIDKTYYQRLFTQGKDIPNGEGLATTNYQDYDAEGLNDPVEE